MLRILMVFSSYSLRVFLLRALREYSHGQMMVRRLECQQSEPEHFDTRLQVALPVERPTGTIGSAQQFVGLWRVGHLARGAVVLDLLPDAVSHQPEQHHLDHLPGVVEIAGGLEAALAGVDPLLLEVSQRRKQGRLGPRLVISYVGLVALRRQSPRLDSRS